MKFGHEFEQVLANEGFPEQWLGSAIDYKHLKKCIKKVHLQLEELGLDASTLSRLTEWVDQPRPAKSSPDHPRHEFYSVAAPGLFSIPEEFTPQLRVLVDKQTGTPLDATLAPDTKTALAKLARHDMITANRREHLGGPVQSPQAPNSSEQKATSQRTHSITEVTADAKWVQVPLASAQHFFDLLEPKLEELEALRSAETAKLENDILDLGELVENVVQPVREGFEAVRAMSYRDLYFWREMFRLYMERPIFYSDTERNRGALTFTEATARLQAFDEQLRSTGLLAKMKTPQAKQAAKQFFDLNVDVLRIMHFQEMNARAFAKILKKFDKQTHLEAQVFVRSLRTKYPALLPANNATSHPGAGGFANSIARDLHAEIATKVLAIVPQLDDWSCPVCLSMAWRPVSLRCCRSVFCIRCIIKLQDEGMTRCPCCNAETVMSADGRNIDFDTMDFLEKFFPLEVKRRQKENERANLIRERGEEFVKPGCTIM